MAKQEYHASTKRKPYPPTHPGAILREDVLPALRVPVSRAADELGVSRQTLHRILAEKAPVTPEMAVRLGKFCGNGPELWLRLQAAYDLWHAEERLAREVKRIPTRPHSFPNSRAVGCNDVQSRSDEGARRSCRVFHPIAANNWRFGS